MAIYQIDTQMNLATEYWTNVWHVNVASAAAAKTAADTIMDCLIANSQATVIADKARVALYPLNGGQGTIYSYGDTGGQSAYDYLPLFNVIRIDFNADTGRPSRKYLKFPTPEGGQSNGVLDPTVRANYQASVADYLLSAVSTLCDIHGRTLVRASVYPAIGMRQLRRGSKRKTTPIV